MRCTSAISQPVGAIEALVGLLAFSFQIFFDFSGYTDVAIGVALIFGIVLPRNFDAPYRACSIRDFWRRWHMTLSRFLRDYLYVPLGGNRHGPNREIAAIMITMGLGGLWHGAGWGFVIWGLLHGAALIVERLWRRYLPPMPGLIGWALTFTFVTCAWAFFRADSFATAWRVLEAIALMLPGPLFSGWRTVVFGAAAALLLPPSYVICARLTAAPRAVFAVVVALLAGVVVIQLGLGENYEFVYFQF